MKNRVFAKRMILAALAAAVLMITGCGGKAVNQNESEKALLGKWAYAHETDKAAATFTEDGSVKYDGKKYSYTSDGKVIKLTADGKTTELRYETGDGRMYLYKKSVYTYQGTGNANGITGIWKDLENQWTFEFTENETFMEDGALTGYYYMDETPGTIRLVYGEALDDTVFYYSLNGNELTVEYPWLMFKMEK